MDVGYRMFALDLTRMDSLVIDITDLLRSKPQSLLEIVRRHGDAVAPEFRLLTDAAANLCIKDNRRALMEKD